MVSRHIARLALISFAALVTASCEHNLAPEGPATIVVSPDPQSLAAGATQQFTAVVRNAAGKILNVAVKWSTDAGGGSTNSTGMFTAGSTSGTFPNTVVASYGDISDAATVTVTVGPLVTITVTPNPQTLAIGANQQFTAVGRDANGNIVAFTPTWSIVASGGSIAVAGMFTAGTVAGTFASTVKATNGTVSGFATVTVNPGALAAIVVTPSPVSVPTNAQQQFAAEGRDANNNIIPISPAPTWSVDAGHAGGTVLTPSGVYTAPNLVGVGFDSVRATSGSISGAGRANITASGQLMTIQVTPNPATLAPGATVSFTATGFDAQGTVVPTPGLVWSVVPTVGGGTINSSSGLYTAGPTPGTYPNSVKATSGTVSGFATVTVTASAGVFAMGAADTHGLLAGSTFTCAGAPSTINADASVWPGIAYTGFPPCDITGQRHAGDSYAQTAQQSLTTAYLALEAMPCGTTITSDLGGTTLPAGVYCSASTVGVTGTVTFDGGGDPNAFFLIRAGSSLTGVGAVVLINGAQAKNVFWWNQASATIGVGSAWQGNIIALQTITLNNNTTLLGRALARNGAVTIGTGTSITLP